MSIFSPRIVPRWLLLAVILCIPRSNALANDNPPELRAETLADKIDADARQSGKPTLALDRTLELTAGRVHGWDLSADATRVIIADDAHHLATWDITAEPKKLWDVKSDLVHAASTVALSRDGKQALHATLRGEIEVYDATTGKLLHTHKGLSQIMRARFSFDGKRIFASDMQGNSLVTAPTEDGEIHSPPKSATGAPPLQVQMEVTGEKTWWKFMKIDGEMKHWLHDGNHFVTNITEVIPDALPTLHSISAGPNQFVVGDSYKFAVVIPSMRDGRPFLQFNLGRALSPGGAVDFTSDGKFFWIRGHKSIDIARGTEGELVGTIDIPPELPSSFYRCFPDANCICRRIDHGVAIWKVEGNPIQVQMRAGFAIHKLLDEQRFDAIELLAKKWDGRIDHFVPMEHETPTTFLMNRLQFHKLPDETDEERNARYLQWIEENPDNCQFMRIVMFRIYLATGYKARGGGFANTVTEEGWKTFYENMAKMWKVIEPIYDDEHVPAEAYTCAVIAGKNLQWEQAEVNDYISKSFDKWPNYHRTYTEEAVARLPRWGGAPQDTATFAENLANKIGGDDGDMMYAQIARHVAKFEGFRTLPEQTGMSSPRMMRGLVLLSPRSNDFLLWNQALYYAIVNEDEVSARQVCQLFVDSNTKLSRDLWPGKFEMLDKIYEEMQAAKAGNAKGEGDAK